MILIVDFETFYDRKNGYDLKSVPMMDYILDEKFKAHGVGVQCDNETPKWITGSSIPAWISSIDWARTTVVAHNVKFDGSILDWRYGVKPYRWLDTQAMARAAVGVQVPSVSLRHLAGHFKFPSKGELKADGVLNLSESEEREMSEYCLRDVEICRAIYNKLIGQFGMKQLQLMDCTNRAFIEPKLKLNASIAEETAKRLEEQQLSVITASGVAKDDLSSNAKFAELLIKKGYSVPQKKSPRTGKLIPALSVGDTEFQNLRLIPDSGLQRLLDARMAAKQTMERTRATKLSGLAKHGIYPFDMHYSGEEQTHRFSGGNGAGGNPQNFPRASELRKAIVAPDGFRVVVADFSSIELRVLAWLSKDAGLIRAITEGLDLYCDFASRIYGRIITKADKVERQFGKCAILGLGYGMGAERFQKTVKLQLGLDISLEEAQRVVDLYRETYPGVKAFWNECLETLRHMRAGLVINKGPYITGKDGIKLPSGLYIRYPELRQEGREWYYRGYRGYVTKQEDIKIYGGKVTENLCQALAGELCKEAMLTLIKAGLSPSGQVHDELIVVVPEDQADAAKQIVEKAMSTAPSWWPEIKLGCEVGVGQSWGAAKH